MTRNEPIHVAEARLAKHARRHLGLFTRAEAVECGFSRSTIYRRVQSGAWQEVQPAVFAFAGTVDSKRQRVLAAVMAGGDDAVASHATAAALWDLGDLALEAPYHVAVPNRRERSLRGACLHCLETLVREDRVLLGVIPITAVPRTLVDVAGEVEVPLLEDLLIEAFRRRLATLVAVLACLARVPNGPGTGNLRELLRRFDPEQARRLMSRLETRFLLDVIRCYGLPEPVVNRRLEDGEGLVIAKVDFSWPGMDAVVEIDGLRFHSTPSQKAYDDNRQNALVLSGKRVLRYGAKALLTEPDRVAREVAALLGQPRDLVQP